MISLTDLLKPTTQKEIEKYIIDLLVSIGFPVEAWNEGSVGRTLVEFTAALVSKLSPTIATVAKSGFIDLSQGAWLTLLARQLYGLDRKAATIAVGQIRITNTTFSTFGAPAGLLIRTAAGLQYRVTVAVSVGPTSSAVYTVHATAPGGAYTVPLGTPLQLVVGVPGITVQTEEIGTTGTWLSVSGEDEETDESLRERCIGRWSALGYGATERTYAAEALSVSGVTRCTVRGSPVSGTITLTCAGPAGAVPVTVLTTVSDLLEGLLDGISRRSLCAQIVVQSAAPVSVPIQGVVSCTAGRTQYVKAQAEARLLRYFQSIPIGGTVRHGQIVEEIMVVDHAVDVTLVTPTSTFTLASHQVAVPAFLLTYQDV